MIRLQDIIQQYPPKLHIFPKAILREYLQFKILANIFSHPLAKKLCFIGGTALRIGYNSQRFSEDLDFDNWGLTESEFEEITKEIQNMLYLEGYEVEIKHIYKGAFHCVVKIPKLLFDNQLASMSTEKLTIKIDTVSQGFGYTKEQKVLNKFGIISPYSIISPDILLSMKFCAFFSRIKGRDMFDIVYLIGLHINPNRKFLEEKLGIHNAEELHERIQKRIAELDLIQLQRDVQPFLFDANDQSVVLFPQIINQTTFA